MRHHPPTSTKEDLGRRGRQNDPLYSARKLLVMGADRLDETATERLEALLALGDPDAEVSLAYRAKEALSDFYALSTYSEAQERLTSIVDHLKKPSTPKELQVLGGTIERWFTKVMAYHLAHVTNAPTEGLHNPIK